MSEQKNEAVAQEPSTEEVLALALAIIERQHDLLVKHGIDPHEGQLVMPSGVILKA